MHARVLLMLLAGVVLSVANSLASPVHAQSQVADIRLVPSSTSTEPGGTVSLTVQIEPNGQEVNGVDACITFPASLLQVMDADAGEAGVQIQADTGTFSTLLLNTVDNTAGVIKYSAGKLTGGLPTATFTLATVEFQAAEANADATIAFSSSTSVCSATPTDAVLGADSVLRDTFGSSITIGTGAAPTPTATPVPTATATATATPTATAVPTFAVWSLIGLAAAFAALVTWWVRRGAART